MSVDMYVSASKNQAKSVSGMTKQQTTGYEELQKAIADFTLNSPFLTGKAYDTSKAFFSTVLYPLAQGGILLSEAVDKAVTKFPQDYQSQVDSGNLKQSDLEEKIRQADRLIGQAEGIRTMLESSLTPEIIKSSQLAANLRLLESYSGVKRILEEKLDKLMTFNHNSPRIFEEIQALEDAIDQGLAQTTTAFNPATGTFTIPSKGALSWSKTIQEKWTTRDEDEQQRVKEKIEKENLPTTKAEILRDYHWSTNSNMYVNNKTGIPSPEVTGLYNMFVQAEHTSQKNPQLEFFNEMLRTGKHPTTGVKITEAERANAVLMLYTLALQPFVGAWAMSKIPQSAGKAPDVNKNGGGETIISPEMKEKILWGQRKNPNKNEIIGGHSPDINNSNIDYATEIVKINPDGTKDIKYTTQFPDGNLAKIKNSTIFPDGWSDTTILDSISEIGSSTPVSIRGRDGATLHRGVINGVEIDVIKIGDKVISGYPTGQTNAPLPGGFTN